MSALVSIWVWFCAYLNCAGWALSAIHQLNATGYTVTLLLGFAGLWVWRKKTSAPIFPKVRWQKFRRRFRKPFPLAFLILASLSFFGGALYAPTNYDALAYRIPRILHWLAAGQWQWIHTDFNRLNTRGCGIEWVSAPLIALTKTDRLLFLINIVSFLLLPGLVFSLFTRLGVRRRTAWHWMWLVPTGYGFLLQSGGIGNDLFGAVFAMAAIDFALRARQGKKLGDLWLSALAAGLMTASKSFNLVLLLPWAIAIFPSARLLLRRPFVSIFVFAMAAGASLLPTALLNARNCGDWTGLAAEPVNFGAGPPLLYIVANTILLLLHNFAPPVFPFAHAWHDFVQQVIPAAISAQLHQYFEANGAEFQIGEMQMEEWAGLGLGVSFLLLWVLIRQVRCLPGYPTRVAANFILSYEVLISLGAWAALGVIMARSGLSVPARYLLPFYALLMVPLLRGAVPLKLTKSLWWRRAAGGVFLLAGLVLILTPPRPLWPAVSMLKFLGADHSADTLVRRAWTVYSVYNARWDAFEPVRVVLPEDANPLGMVTADDPETTLWQPFGSRSILHICRSDGPEKIRSLGIKYALVSGTVVNGNYKMSVDDWLARNNAEVLQHFSLTLLVTRGATDWYLVRMR